MSRQLINKAPETEQFLSNKIITDRLVIVIMVDNGFTWANKTRMILGKEPQIIIFDESEGVTSEQYRFLSSPSLDILTLDSDTDSD